MNKLQRAFLIERFMGQFPDENNNPRMAKSQSLYNLGYWAWEGDIVELGTFHGNGTISLYWGTQAGYKVEVFTVDDYAERTGWIGEKYGASDLEVFLQNIADAEVQVTLIPKPAEEAVKEWIRPISLLYWDLWGERLASDFKAWNKWIVPGGVFAMHEPGDRRFGGERLIETALKSGEWEDLHALPGFVWAIRKAKKA